MGWAVTVKVFRQVTATDNGFAVFSGRYFCRAQVLVVRVGDLEIPSEKKAASLPHGPDDRRSLGDDLSRVNLLRRGLAPDAIGPPDRLQAVATSTTASSASSMVARPCLWGHVAPSLSRDSKPASATTSSRRVEWTKPWGCAAIKPSASAPQKGRMAYPEELRRVSNVDPETKQALVFLTNQFDLAALIMPRYFGAAGPSNFSSAGSSSTCACADFSATGRTECGPNLDRTVRIPSRRYREATKELSALDV